MAASCCSASPSLDLTFLRPISASTRLRFSLSTRNSLRKSNHSSTKVAVRGRIRSVRTTEEVILVEKEDGRIDVGGNGSVGNVNGVENLKSLNGSVAAGGENGRLVKYVNGNGNGYVNVVEKKGETKKKTIEEIGQEEAWFKRSGKGKVEVSVTPGGRWNRFKTYSTIQRTCEIWGFVLTFLFKVWFNNQKFAYRG
ncbi:hypothetical protein Hanom_Chr14g01284941 [Helianthus anomalus]